MAVPRNAMQIITSESTAMPWYKRTHLLRLQFVLASLLLFSSTNGYDGSVGGSQLALTQWNDFMDYPTGDWLGFINVLGGIAMIVAYPFCAWSANKHGRRWNIWVGYIAIVIGTTMQTAAPNPGVWIASKVFFGISTAAYGTSAPVLTMELAYPGQQGTWGALFNCGWNLGGIVAAWTVFGTRNWTGSWAWRLPSLLQALLPMVALPGFLLCPESPRWLISVGRHEAAREVLAKLHAGGDINSDLINAEMFEISEAIRLEKETMQSTSYMDMLKTKGNRRRTMISVTLGAYGQLVGNNVISYYLPLVLNTVGITSITNQTLINGCLQIWNFLWAVAASFTVDRLGRRLLFITSGVVMLVAYICVTGLSGSFAQTGVASVGLAAIPMIFIYFAGYDIALVPLTISYPCEIWPFAMRSKGLTVSQIAAAVFGNIQTFINPIGLGAIDWKFYIVFLVIIIMYLITVILWYPETRGTSLEMMSLTFDDDIEIIDAVNNDKAADVVISAKPKA